MVINIHVGAIGKAIAVFGMVGGLVSLGHSSLPLGAAADGEHCRQEAEENQRTPTLLGRCVEVMKTVLAAEGLDRNIRDAARAVLGRHTTSQEY